MKASVKPDPKLSMTPSWELVKPSWQLLQKNVEPVIFLYFLPALVLILANLLLGDSLYEHAHGFTPRQHFGLYIYGLGLLWSIFNSGPAIWFQLKATAGKTPTLGSVYRSGLPYTLPIIGFYLLYFVALSVGFILLIVPAFIIFRRYLLTPYYMVDKKLPIRQALRQAAEETKPVSGFIWGTIGVEIVFVMASAVLQVIPLIGAIIGQAVSYVVLFTIVLRYRQLQPAAKATKA